MSVRQYVGARYVPQFANPIEWNPNMAYEALTIVTYLNSSYTSKTPVTPGIPPTNTAFWALTGNYNAQVEDYRQTVEEYKAEVTAISTSFSNFKCVNVKDYGATGNGITDDAPFFQLALNTGKHVYVPTNNGEQYLIKTALNFNTIRQAFFGDVQTLPTGGTSGQIVFNYELSVACNINVSDVRISNLSFRSNYVVPQPRQTTFFKAKNLNSPQDLDIYINDCMFYGSYVLLAAYGRGIEFKRNTVVSAFKTIVSEYYPEPDAEPLRAKYGYRNITISNNRYHGVAGSMFENSAGDLLGFVFTENQSDVGTRGLVFAGVVKDSIISNNIIHFSTAASITLSGGYDGLAITGNTFKGDSEVGISGAFIIVPSAATTAIGLVISGNVFDGSTSVAINLQAPQNYGLTVCNNFFQNLGTSSSGMPVALTGTYTGATVSGNSFISKGQAATGICYSFNAVLNDFNLAGNAGVTADLIGTHTGSPIRSFISLFT